MEQHFIFVAHEEREKKDMIFFQEALHFFHENVRKRAGEMEGGKKRGECTVYSTESLKAEKPLEKRREKQRPKLILCSRAQTQRKKAVGWGGKHQPHIVDTWL